MAVFTRPVKCLWVRQVAYITLEYLKGASLRQALTLITNIKLGWKGLPLTNTLAY
jgi:hypothetical protein